MVLIVVLFIALVITGVIAVMTYRDMKEIQSELRKSKARQHSLQRELNYYRPRIEWEK
jgi:hypothetical protein